MLVGVFVSSAAVKFAGVLRSLFKVSSPKSASFLKPSITNVCACSLTFVFVNDTYNFGVVMIAVSLNPSSSFAYLFKFGDSS